MLFSISVKAQWNIVGSNGFSAAMAGFNSLAIAPDGTPYVSYISSASGPTGSVIVKKFDGSNWVSVGTSDTVASEPSAYTSIAVDGSGTPYLAFCHMVGTIDSFPLKVMKFDGSNWVQVGNDSFSSYAYHFEMAGYVRASGRPEIAISSTGTPYVFFRDILYASSSGYSYKNKMAKFDGTRWVTIPVEEGLTAPDAPLAMALNGSGVPYEFIPASPSYLVKKYNGSTWDQVGGGVAVCLNPSVFTTDINMAVNSADVPYIVFADAENGERATVKKFNGTAWVVVGAAGFSAGFPHNPKIKIDPSGTPYVLYTDNASAGKATVMKFDGTNWIVVEGVGFAGPIDYPGLAINSSGIPYVSFRDGSLANKATVMRYGTGTQPNSGSPYACVGSTTTLSNATSGGTWSSSNTSVATVGSSSGVATGVTVGTAIISYVNGANVSKTLVTITSVSPTVAAITGASNIYIGAPVTFSNTKAGGVWGTSNANASITTFGVLSGLVTGTSTVSYTVSNGCSTAVATKVVTVNAPTAQQWENVGNPGFTTTTFVHDMALDPSGTPYVISQTSVLKYNGTSWVNVGSDFNTGYTLYPGIAIDASGIPYVVFSDWTNSGKVTVRKYNGSAWVNVGSPMSTTSGSNNSITIDGSGTIYVAYAQQGDNKCIVKKFDGTSWSTVGTGTISVGGAVDNRIRVDNSGNIYVGYKDLAYSQKATVMKYDGTTWSVVGGYGVTSGRPDGNKSMNIDDSGVPYVAFRDSASGGKLAVVKYNGTAWVSVGPATITEIGINAPCVTVDSNGLPWVSYNSSLTGAAKISVVKYNGSSWEFAGNPDFSSEGSNHSHLSFNPGGTPIVGFSDRFRASRATVMTLGDALPPITGSSTAFAGSTITLSNTTPGGTWSSSTPSVATVGSSSGIVTGVSSGTATISYIVGSSIVTTVVTICAVPTITSVSPMTAIPGATVTITGTNFNSTPSNNVVYFGATGATVTAASTTSLAVVMPVSGTYAFVTADNLTCGRTASSIRQFVPSFNNSAYLPDSVHFTDGAPWLADEVIGGNPKIAIRDMDGDGKPDVVSLPENYSSAGVTVYRNISTSGTLDASSFAAGVSYAVTSGGVDPWKLFVSDIDGDGKADIMVISDSIAVLRNTSVPGTINASSFAPRVKFALQSGVTNLTIGDINGDGKVDIWEVTADSATMVLNNSAIGLINFGAPYSLGMGAAPDHMDIADIDGDGKFDLLYSAGNQLSIHKNYTAPIDTVLLLGPPYVITMSGDMWTSQISHFTCGDLDGDGKPELAVTKTYANAVLVYRNTATTGFINSGSFASPVSFATDAYPSDIAIADVNGDAKPDIAVIDNYDSYVGIFRNKSTPGAITTSSFASPTNIDLSPGTAPGIAPKQILVCDMDGDGPADLVLGGIDWIGFGILRSAPVGLPEITGASNVCVAATTTLSSTVTGGTWSSSTTGVATVGSTNGVVSGIAVGTATISYNFQGIITTTTITVNPLADAGTITGASTVAAGSTITLSNTVSGGTWSSGSSNATVSSAGVVTGITPGTAMISYSVTNSCGMVIEIMAVTVTPSCNSWAIAGDGGFSPGDAYNTSIAIDGGGTPYVAYRDGTNSDKVTVKKFSGGAWLTVGAECFSAGGAYHLSIAIDSSDVPYVAYQDAGNGNKATVKKFSGGTWSTVGSEGFSPSEAYYTSIAIDGSGTPYVAYLDYANSDKATVKKFSGGSWLTVGSEGFSAGVVGTMFIAIDGSGVPYVAYKDGAFSGRATVKKFSGGSWATVGSDGFSAGGTQYMSMAIDGSGVPYVAYKDNGNGGKVTVKKFSGGSWINVGSAGFSANTAEYTSIAIDGSGTPFVGYADYGDGGKATVKKFSGGSWVTVGSAGFSAGYSEHLSLAISGSGTPYVAYEETGVDYKATVQWFNSTSLTPITGTATVCVGATISLSNPTTGGTWSSDNTTVATVGSSGIVSGVAPGTAIISYAAGGCFVTMVITVSTSDAGTITGASTVAAGSTITLSNTVSGGTWSSGSSNATVSSAGVVTGVTAGTAMISYTTTNSCGSAVATKVVTITSPPVDSIGGSSAVCIGSSITLSNPTSGGIWSAGNTKATVGSASGIVTGVASGTVVISYNLSGVYTTMTVTVNPLPAAITGTLSACAGGTLALSSSTTGGTWSSSNTAAATVGATGSVTTISAGTSTISYMLSTGCAAIATVTVNTVPDAITGATNVCVGLTTSLSTTSTGGTWSSSAPGVANVSATGVVTGMSTGSATITYTLSGGCKATTIVSVNSVPAAITGTAVVCQGRTTTLGNITSGGAWSSGNTSVATVGASTGIVSGVAAGAAMITYSTGTGCYSTKVVTVNPAPAAITGTLTVCPGSSTSLTSATGTGVSWVSSTPSVATINSGTGVATGVATGTTTITYTIGSGCATTAVLTVNGTPATISGPANVCLGRTMTLANAVSGGVWASSNATVASVDGSTGVVTGNATGTVTITYATGTGCYKTKAITSNANPNASGGYKIACVGLTTQLTNVSGGVWSSSDTFTAKTTVGGTNAVVTGVAPGTANITFTLSSTGCYNVSVVTVNAVPPAITGSALVCVSSSTTLANTTPGGTWSSSNTAIANVGSATGIVTSGTLANVATISYNFGANCRVTKVVTVKAIPNVISGPSSLCIGGVVTYTNTTTGGTWSSSNTAAATVVAGSAASYGVVTGMGSGVTTLSYTNAPSCTRTFTVTVAACRGANTSGIDNANNDVAVSLYPNPTTGSFTVNAHTGGILHVYSMDGKELDRYEIAIGETQITLPNELARGIYMCRFNGEDGSAVMVRLVVE
jgi:uncharacterized protein YjdB